MTITNIFLLILSIISCILLNNYHYLLNKLTYIENEININSMNILINKVDNLETQIYLTNEINLKLINALNVSALYTLLNKYDNLLTKIVNYENEANLENDINWRINNTNTSYILKHANKKSLIVDSFNDMNVILKHINNSKVNITKSEYELIEKFFNEKYEIISSRKHMYLINNNYDVIFHIFNRRFIKDMENHKLTQGDIYFAYINKTFIRGIITFMFK